MKLWGEPTAIYRLYDCYEQLLYVGMTNSPARRYEEHAETQPWWPEVGAIREEWFPHRAIAEREEEYIIWTEQPRYNRERILEQWFRPRPGPEPAT